MERWPAQPQQPLKRAPLADQSAALACGVRSEGRPRAPGAGTAKQKFQKFCAEDEFRALLRPYFRDVRRASLDIRDSALVMVCRRPVVIRKAQLATALRFEFELKIDGKPLGRSERAIAAFGRYLDRRHCAA